MAITFVGASSVLTNDGTGWAAPGNVTRSGVTRNDLLLTLGGWWDAPKSNGGLTPLPYASNGQAMALMTPRNPNSDGAPGWPVSLQIAGILGCNSGTHVFTPFDVTPGGGDGSFVALQFTAGGAGYIWRLITQGSNYSGSASIGGVTSVTVTTVDANAKIGDLVVAGCTSDGNPTAVGLGGPTSSGYTQSSSGATSTSTLPIGTGYKIATADGAQSATWGGFTGGDVIQILAASIVVLRATPIDAGSRYFRQKTQSGIYLLDPGDGDFPAELVLQRWF